MNKYKVLHYTNEEEIEPPSTEDQWEPIGFDYGDMIQTHRQPTGVVRRISILWRRVLDAAPAALLWLEGVVR